MTGSPPKYPVIRTSTKADNKIPERSIGWVEWSDAKRLWSVRFGDDVIAELPDLRHINLAGVALSSGNGYQGQSK